MLPAVGIEGADEEEVAGLAEHHRCIEAAAIGHGPDMVCGLRAALGDEEASGEVGAHGIAEGLAVGDGNEAAIGGRD